MMLQGKSYCAVSDWLPRPFHMPSVSAGKNARSRHDNNHVQWKPLLTDENMGVPPEICPPGLPSTCNACVNFAWVVTITPCGWWPCDRPGGCSPSCSSTRLATTVSLHHLN